MTLVISILTVYGLFNPYQFAQYNPGIRSVVFRQPPHLGIYPGIEFGDIGFEVEQRGSIQYVNSFDFQSVVLPGNQADDRQPERVRLARK